MENLLQNLLRRQFLIAAFIEQKLQILNFIKEGYDNNKPVLINNAFLHFTGQIYYRSIIVDLWALFGPATKSNKNSFSFINKNFKQLLQSGSIESVKEWLDQRPLEIKSIENLRHKQMAHYDFTTQASISLNFDNLSTMNDLLVLAQKIICFCGTSFNDNEFSLGFDFGRRCDELYSLEMLINQPAPTPY